MHLYRVASAIVALQIGCGAEEPCAIGEDAKLVSIEEGGFCTGPDPCWIRTSVVDRNTIVLEGPTMRMTSELSVTEVESLFKYLEQKDFCSALEMRNTCTITFETSVILKVETSDASFVDTKAGDCIFSPEKSHPYQGFYYQLRRIREAHFSGAS